MKQIICTITKKTGAVSVKAEGYAGASCLAATKELEAKLGLVDAHREETHEMHQTEEERQRLGGGA